MVRHVLILGAGFGGLELATRLSETIADSVRVTLIDRNDSFYFGFSKLDVMLGHRSADKVRLHYGDVARESVEFRRETVTGIDPLPRRHGSRTVRRCPTTSSSASRFTGRPPRSRTPAWS